MILPPWLRGARAATIFLTRIPVGGFPFRPEDWRWAPAYFPLVGAALGVVQAGVFRACLGGGSAVAAAVTIIASLLLTGAFHEDGLADTADALGGAYDREKLFVILKDSRVGSFGASALVCALVLRVLLIARLDGAGCSAIVLAQCISRVPPIWLMVALPYVSHDAAAKSRTVARAGPAQALLATVIGAAVGTVALGIRAVTGKEMAVVTLVICCVAGVCGWRFWRRAGGITGDFLGATQQVVELALLLALVLMRP